MSSGQLVKVFGAVNLGSWRIAAIVAGVTDSGELRILGSHQRASQGIKRGYITDMRAATYAVRDAIDKAEKMAEVDIDRVWIASAGAGLASRVSQFELDIGGRRIESEDIEALLMAARDGIEPEGRMTLHAQPAHYTLDGAHGVGDPEGLHAERLGVDIHVMLADGAPIRNLTETVQKAHLSVAGVVAAPLAAGHACLTEEERELGVALVEYGAQVTNVALFAAGMLVDLRSIPLGSADMTDAVASIFGIRRFQAERLKCRWGSAEASPADHRDMIPVNGPGETQSGPHARGADENNRIPRAELVSVIGTELDRWMKEVGKALGEMGFLGARGHQVVVTGGGAELAGIADYAQGALGTSVRIGKPMALVGLAEAHTVPAFTTLAGLAHYAATDPVDIRTIGARRQNVTRLSGGGAIGRLWQAVREHF